MKSLLVRAGIFVAVLVLLELSRRAEFVSPLILASPSEVAQALSESGDEFLAAFLVTLGETAQAIVVTWTSGLTAGLVFGSSPLLATAAGPILGALFAIPLIVLYPLFIAWFGIGPASKVIFGAVAGFFPIAINTMEGVRALDRRFEEYGRSIGASQATILLRILLPFALPSILSGLRIGTSLIVVNVIVSEMLASFAGLGFWISYHRTMFETGHVYLGIILALLCVVVVNWTLSIVEKRYFAWNTSRQQA